MNPLMERWQSLAAQLDQRSVRERALVMVALLAVVWGAFDVAWLGPHNKALSALEASNLDQGRKRVELIAHLQLQRQQLQTPVNEAAARKKQQLFKDLAVQQQSLMAGGRNMLSPDEVVGLLQRLLQSRSGLKTLSLRNLKPEPAVQALPPEIANASTSAAPGSVAPASGTSEAATAALPAQTPVLWRHGIELRIRGNYADIVNYLQQLEEQQPRLHWQSLQLDNDTGVGVAHTITATLVISTLSLETPWLAF
jgi:MSHA biogenesis protein MshJ